MAYKTDLTDAQWDLINKYFEPASKRGNGYKHEKRTIVNALLYLVKGGIQWRLMPNDDTKSACDVLAGVMDKYPSIQAFFGDAGYRGTAVQ